MGSWEDLEQLLALVKISVYYILSPPILKIVFVAVISESFEYSVFHSKDISIELSLL